jgi:RHS repeat-associated protein
MTKTMTRSVLLAGLFAAAPAGALAEDQVVEFYHLDAVGNVRAVTDEAGQVIERHDYLPFGEEWCPGPPAGVCGSVPPGQPKRFTGKERDPETGLDYFGARYYGSRVARFTAVDPVLNIPASLTDPQRWNRYAYGLNNPLKLVDLDGRDAVWVTNSDGTSTLVIPVSISGAGATDATKAAIVARANGIASLDQKVSIDVVPTDKAIEGKLNRLDVSPGLDKKMCGGIGECINRLGGNKGHINSARHDAVSAAAHDIFHFAGIQDAYKEGPRDEQGRRTNEILPGYTERNIMASTNGAELTAKQLQQAKENRSTRLCSGSGGQCR